MVLFQFRFPHWIKEFWRLAWMDSSVCLELEMKEDMEKTTVIALLARAS